MFGIIPKPLWEKKTPPDPQNRIDLTLRLWAIEIADRFILIDTGIGNYHEKKFSDQMMITGSTDPIKESLALISKKPEQVTDLIMSHLHFDHAGGIATLEQEKMVPTFPNATLHLHKDHYAYAKNPTARDQGSFHKKIFVPIVEYYQEKNKVNWLTGEENTLLKEGNFDLKFKVSHGHTPHMIHPFNDQFIYLADLIPTSHHIPIPWVMGYDIAPGITTDEKKEILNFVLKENLKVIFEHDPLYWGANLELNQKNRITPKELYKANIGLDAYKI